MGETLDDAVEACNSKDLFVAGIIGVMTGALVGPGEPVVDFVAVPMLYVFGASHLFYKYEVENQRDSKYVATSIAVGHCVGKMVRYLQS